MNRTKSFREILLGWIGVIVAGLAAFGAVGFRDAHAAGLLVADGGFGGVLEIKEHEVDVTINNGIAVTKVTQVFHNTENRQVEALYTFPVPKGASVANFSMWINGKEMVGEVLEKKRAREIYNSYKQTRRDPGLLEQVDYKTFEMRIFPINPQADQRVEITYYQELPIDNDQATYVYPLATVTRDDIDSRTTGKFAINADIRSAVPLTSVVSPSHPDDFVTVDHSPNYTQASLETAEGSLAEDVVLNIDMSRPRTGVDLIASRPPGEDGYFVLMLTAGEELAALDRGMDYVFLLDISGSMANDGKLIVSKRAVTAFIDELVPEDRYEVLTFNVNPNPLFGELTPASAENLEMAGAFLDSQRARGGTVLAPAMGTAYKYGDPDRTLNVVILSDGMTEQAERAELLQLIAARPRNARVFCIGVGNEVNRPLLEQLAEDSGGLAAFVSGGDNFSRAAKAFRRKLMRPVATDLSIAVKGVETYDVEPGKVPNLYHGAPIRLYGRYRGSGEAAVEIRGNIQGREMNQSAPLTFPDMDTGNPEIERMWAWKRVDQLQKTADRTGSRASVVDEIVRLGETFSIVTEYTSFLVLENDAEYQRWKIDRRNRDRISRDRAAQTARETELAALRRKAVADIGPQAAKPEPEAGEKDLAMNRSAGNPASPAPAAPPRTQPNKVSRRSNSQNFDLNFGTGPVGPLFVGAAYWLRRRKKGSRK